jgi:ACS family glucarate transporter-like MFS transporter
MLVTLMLLAVKFYTDMEQPAEWGTISDIAGRSAATVFGCVNTVGAVGGALSGPLIGLVLRGYSIGGKPTAAGWNAVFAIIAAEYVLGALCWFWIDPRRQIHRRGEAG